MSVLFRNYRSQAGITEDYIKVRDFFVKRGYAEYSYTRWDWMTTHGYLDKTAVGKIGIWQETDRIVGVATFDCRLGEAFCITLPEYEYLKREMLLYAEKNLCGKEHFQINISDSDLAFQDVAADLGYIATASKESDAAFYIDKCSTSYELPEGFHITSMRDTFDLRKYRRVLWKGFDHELNGEGEFSFRGEDEEDTRAEMIRPNVDLSLKVAVVAPDGNFVSYCGMWYDPEAGFAVVEPVATDPDYRKMGMGKAAVLEGLRRVGELGAKVAYVGSSQQFYYSIGFRPYTTSTYWKKR